MQCTNHVKQISLALHNFADVYKEQLPSDGWLTKAPGGAYSKAFGGFAAGAAIPEGTVTNASILVSILPFVEQQAIYEKFDFAPEDETATPASGTGTYGWGISNTATDVGIIDTAKINYFICPSGNHAGAKSSPFVASYVGVAGGTNYSATGLVASNQKLYGLADGTVVYFASNSTAFPLAESAITTNSDNFKKNSLGGESPGRGVFPAGEAGTLKMADGTSNTIAFGEIAWDAGDTDKDATWGTQLGAWYKGAMLPHSEGTAETSAGANDAVSPKTLGYRSYYTKVVTPFDAVKVGEGNPLKVNKGLKTNGARSKIITTKREQTLIQNMDEVEDDISTPDIDESELAWSGSPYKVSSNAGSWGSNHTSVAVFGLGDGSVRGITDSIQNSVICNLAAANDGVAVTLP
jgi:hypothetical protein